MVTHCSLWLLLPLSCCAKPPEVALFEQFPWLLTIPSIAIIGREVMTHYLSLIDKDIYYCSGRGKWPSLIMSELMDDTFMVVKFLLLITVIVIININLLYLFVIYIV